MPSKKLEKLNQTNLIIAVGSIDGILTTAAAVRLLGRVVPVIWTQAFQVDKINLDGLEPNRRILFVDLAVNNQNPEMTKNFVNVLQKNGHEIIGVCDEHDAEAWSFAFGAFDNLAVSPESQAAGTFKSSGSILLAQFADDMDEHGRELCESANLADAFNFKTHFGAIANEAIKSDIQNNNRRTKLAGHLAFNREADEEIQDWIAEYQEILANHQVVLGKKQILAPGVVRIDTKGAKVDMTTLMSGLYREFKLVVVAGGKTFDKATKSQVEVVGFGTNEKGVDFVAALNAADVSAIGGFAQKVSVTPENENLALKVLSALFKSE